MYFFGVQSIRFLLVAVRAVRKFVDLMLFDAVSLVSCVDGFGLFVTNQGHGVVV